MGAKPDCILVVGNELRFRGWRFRCAIGRCGVSGEKMEGDGATPIGTFLLRECWYRADRIPAPATKLPLKIINQNDGWCDDPGSPEYNRHVTLPFPSSHEVLWRDDHAYDIIVPLGYNDNPILPGKGSAIFLHLAKDGYPATEGCVALAKDDLLAILPEFSIDTSIEITV